MDSKHSKESLEVRKMVALVSAVLGGTYESIPHAVQALALRQMLCAEMLSGQGVTADYLQKWENVLSRQRNTWLRCPLLALHQSASA